MASAPVAVSSFHNDFLITAHHRTFLLHTPDKHRTQQLAKMQQAVTAEVLTVKLLRHVLPTPYYIHQAIVQKCQEDSSNIDVYLSLNHHTLLLVLGIYSVTFVFGVIDTDPDEVSYFRPWTLAMPIKNALSASSRPEVWRYRIGIPVANVATIAGA